MEPEVSIVPFDVHLIEAHLGKGIKLPSIKPTIVVEEVIEVIEEPIIEVIETKPVEIKLIEVTIISAVSRKKGTEIIASYNGEVYNIKNLKAITPHNADVLLAVSAAEINYITIDNE